jgi:hypothetical protein
MSTEHVTITIKSVTANSIHLYTDQSRQQWSKNSPLPQELPPSFPAAQAWELVEAQ